MAAIFAKKSPLTAPGSGVAEALRSGVRALKSDDVLYNASSPVTLFDVPENTIVEKVIVEVVTAFDGLVPSISLGVTGTTERHVATNDVDVKATGFTLIQKPYEYTSPASIILTIVPSTATVGKVRVWLFVRTRSDLQV